MKVLSFIFGLLVMIGLAMFFILPGWYTAGIIFLGFSLILGIVTSLKKKYETKCSKCKTKYDYDTDVEWRLVKREVKGTPSTSDTLVRTVFTYDITCHCSECGKIKKYRKKINGPSVNNKYELNDINPEYVLEEGFSEPKPVGCGAIFIMLLMAIGLAVGGLLFGGYFDGALDNIDINIPGVTETEKGEDPKDYYGTYYCVNDSTLIVITVDADKCTMVEFNGITAASDTYEYEYASAAYVEQRLPSAQYKTDSLLLYPSSDRSKAIVLSVEKTASGYQLRTNSGALATTEVLTMDDVTNDPKDYYGTYTLQNFYVVLNSNGSAVMDLGDGAEQYTYMYANAAYLSKWYGKSYNAGIILVQAGVDGAVIFNYENGTLILQDTYTFTK